MPARAVEATTDGAKGVEVYTGARPPPPPAKRAKNAGDGEVKGDANADVVANAHELADEGVDFSMKMWTTEGERVSKSRKARIQYDPEHGPRIRHRSDAAKGDFNVWWGKYATSGGVVGREHNSAVAAVTRCAPILDAGITLGDRVDADKAAVCYHFARGCCTSGSSCEYLHRLPTAFDDAKTHMMLDIFGRPKHHTERDDNGGTGSYMRIGRTLYMYFGGAVNPNWGATKVHEEITKQFGEWGPIEDVTVKFDRRFAFVRYKFRVSAEFAKEAMAGQTLWPSAEEVLNVRWANDDPNPIAIVRVQNETEERVRDMFLRAERAKLLMKYNGLGVDGEEDEGQGGGDGANAPGDKQVVVSNGDDACVSFDPSDYE